MKKEIEKIIELGKKATVKGGSMGIFIKSERGEFYESFFENWDDERTVFYYLLRQNGFKDAGYNASYHWKVANDKVKLEYVEGDLYLSPSNI
jgi:hypothetical protein